MSSKVAVNVCDEIRKSLTAAQPARSSHEKQDFKLKRFQGNKGGFGASTLCAGTVFGLSGLKD
ncbi:MAG TPA: hypothetical protein VF651_09760 [Gammaproteobacteria bacterium]